jgi:hypothetical protein
MSRKKKIARALAAGVALYGASKLMGMGANKTGKQTVSDAQKKSQVPKIKKPTRVIDTGSKTMVGSNVKTTVDVDALPREVKEKAQKVAKTNETIKKAVIKRRDEGMLSPTMPKRANQLSSDFGLGAMDGAKKGKMVRARGGGLAKGGMRPTKLY